MTQSAWGQRINFSGIVTSTAQSMVKVITTNTISIPNASNTGIFFSSVIIDNTNLVSNTGGDTTISILESGYYLIDCTVMWAASGTGTRRIRIVKDLIAIGTNKISPSGAGSTEHQAIVLTPLGNGDDIECRVRQDSGGALNLRFDDEVTHFSIIKIW